MRPTGCPICSTFTGSCKSAPLDTNEDMSELRRYTPAWDAFSPGGLHVPYTNMSAGCTAHYIHSHTLYLQTKDIQPTMHLSIDEQKSGWFPAINIQHNRSTDILLAAVVVGLCIGALLFLVTQFRLLVGAMARTVALMLFGLFAHLVTVLVEAAQFLFDEVMRIPIAWYSVMALTIIPMATDIPRWAGVLYLLAFCVANTWVMVWGIQHKAAPSKTDKKTKDAACATSKKPDGSNLSTQLFTGMRISIQS